MNFFVSNQENLQIHQYTALIQEISTIFKDRLPTYLAFRKVHSFLGSEFLTVYHEVLQIFKNEKTQFQVTLKRYLDALSFYCVDKFLACTDDL
jgi:hypothetical protein